MRRPLSLLAAALLAAAPVVQAFIFRDQINQIDYHYQLVGVPLVQFTHRPRPDDRASLLYTLSDAGVLGAVNPGTGGLVWRQLLDDTAEQTTTNEKKIHEADRGRLVAVDGEDWLAAGLGSSVHAWHAASGRAIWWQDFAGELVGLDLTTSKPTKNSRRDVLALFHEPTSASTAPTTVLRRLDGANGHVLWEHRETAAPGSQPLQVRALGENKALVVSAGGTAGVQAIVLDALTGKRLEEHALAGKATSVDSHDVLFIGGGAAAAPALVAWTDRAHAKIRVSVLDPKPQKFEFVLPADTAEVLVHAPRNLPASLPLHFVVHTRTAVDAAGKQQHRAQVFHVDPKTKAITKAYDLPHAPGAGAFAASVSAAGDAIYFTRMTDDEMVLIESESHGILGRWPVAAATAGTTIHATGAAAAEVVAKPGGDGYAVRAAVVTDSQDWVLVRNGLLAWSRPEGLTGAVAAAFAEHPESEQLVRALEQEAHSNPLAAYAHRVQRHFADLEHLPAYLQSVSQRFLNSILGSSSQTTATTTPESDAFGFHKLAILATKRGRLYGIDAASPGTIRWSKKAVDLAPGTTWAVQRIYVDEAEGKATVFGQTAGLSVAVRIETGETVAAETSPSLQLLAGDKDAAIASTALVTSAAGVWVLPVPQDGQWAANTIPVAQCPRETVVVRAGEALQGVRFVEQTGQCVPEVTWTFIPPGGSRIAHVAVRPAHDPVASIGRVLGDRRVLYKYLNPHVAVVAAVDEAAATLTTVLLDTVSGVVLAVATYAGVDGSKPVECLLVENSFLCTFFGDYVLSGDGKAPAAIKGHHLAVSDLYESLTPNERSAGATGNVSSLQPLETVATTESVQAAAPAVVSQTWVVAAALRALAVTQTRQSITVRQVLAYLPGTHGILGLPRVAAVLDARRPVGRDPTPQELEEGLTRYSPNLEIDPRMVVTHERDVAGIQAIVTAPTHVESTSLVLAFGAVDVFGTRLAPSMTFDLLDKGFNKASMLATVAALAVGVAVLRPMVAKKQINMRWQAPA